MFTWIKHDKTFFGLVLLMLLAIILSLILGSSSFGFKDWLNFGENEIMQKIVLQHRLPRTLTAILTGITLPLSGWVLQEFFRNPLAGPSILGVTSSAGLGVAIVIVLGTSLGFGNYIFEPGLLIFGALLGAFLAMIILIGIAKQLTSTNAMIIVGFMIATLAGAFIEILQYFSNAKELKSYVLWGFGSLSGLSYKQLLYYLLFSLVGIFLIFKNIPSLIRMQLGELYAQTMGVQIKSLRLQLIISSSVLAGVATALVGPIAFVGLAVPHICRIYLKTSNFYRLFAYNLVVGIILMCVFGLIAELFPGGSLPINVITALFGAPIVLSIVFFNKNQLS